MTVWLANVRSLLKHGYVIERRVAVIIVSY